MGDDIVFHDRAGGGWYCKVCKQYLHIDIVPSHKHNPLAQPSQQKRRSHDPGQ